MQFKINTHSFEQRRKRILYGLVFSALLAALIGHQHFYYPEDYNDALFWSVIGFIGLANAVGYYRHRKYLGRAKSHSIELLEGSIRFTTGDQVSKLDLQDVAAIRVFKLDNGIGHIQLQLRNGRGIRLEDYNGMEKISEELGRQLPDKQMAS